MASSGRFALILLLGGGLLPGCGSAQSEPEHGAVEQTAAPEDAAAEAAITPASAPDAGAIEAPIPTCHRFCRADLEQGCGHWGSPGRGGARGPRPGPSARPRWLTCDPACCDPSAPSRVEAAPVSLADLVAAASVDSASRMISFLGGHEISVYCPSSGWQPTAAGGRESAPCPAGRVAWAGLTATLAVVVTRRIDDPSIAEAELVLTAETNSAEWAQRVRDMLIELRASRAGASSADRFDLGAVYARLEAGADGTPARLHLQRTPGPVK